MDIIKIYNSERPIHSDNAGSEDSIDSKEEEK